MTPPTLAPLLTVLSFALAVGIVATHPLIRARADRRDARALLLLLALGILLSLVGADGSVYYGNEYEDSYEYVTSADWLRWNRASWRLFYNPTCIVGANASCHLAGVTSHPIGFASLIAAIPHEAADSTTIAIAFSRAAHILTLVPLYLAALVTTGSRMASTSAAIVFAILPIGALYAGTPMDMSVSVLFASLAVLLWLLLIWEPIPTGLLAPGGLALVMIAAVLLRRDHLVLLAAAPVAALACASRPIQVLRRGLPLLAAGLLIWMFLDPAISGMESTGSYVSRFGVRYFVDLFPTFLWSLSRLDWYVGLPALSGLALLLGIREPAVRFWAVLALGYLALFSAFDHGYYYPRTGEVSEAHLGRYMVQCLPALSVLAGMGVERIRDFLHLRFSLRALAIDRTLIGVAAIWVGAAVWQSGELRDDRIASEQSYRIEPAKRLVGMLPAGAVVVTIEPLVIHAVSERAVFAISLAALDSRLTISGLAAATGVDEIYYARRGECAGIDRERNIAGCQQMEALYERRGIERVVGGDFGDLVRIPVEKTSE